VASLLNGVLTSFVIGMDIRQLYRRHAWLHIAANGCGVKRIHARRRVPFILMLIVLLVVQWA